MFNKTLNGSNKLQKRVAMYVSVEEQQQPATMASTSEHFAPRDRGHRKVTIKGLISRLCTKAKQHKIVQRVLRRRKAPITMRLGCSTSSTTPLLANRPQYNPALYRQQIESYFDLNESADETSDTSSNEDDTSRNVTLTSNVSDQEFYSPGLRVLNLSAADEQAAVDEYFVDFDGGPYCQDNESSEWLLEERQRNDSAYAQDDGMVWWKR